MYTTPCLKKADHFYCHDTFGKCGPRFVMFSVLNSERICAGSWNENCHLT